MVCQKCHKREAVVHLVKISNGSKSQMHLCVRCAAKLTASIEGAFELDKILGELLAQIEEPVYDNDLSILDDITPEPSISTSTSARCPECGISEGRIKDSRIFGCEHDYIVFDKFVASVLDSFQDGNTRHTGKIPYLMDRQVDRTPLIIHLKQQLFDAVDMEEYELASEIRDRIQTLQCN